MKGLVVAALRTAVVVGLAVPSACGGSTADSSGAGTITVRPAPGATAGNAALPSQETLRTYFDGVASGTLPSLEKAKTASAPGSAAAGYVTYLAAAARAVADGGEKAAAPAATGEVTHGDYRFCAGSGSAEACYRYSDITGAGGKVVDFSVNGKPVHDRVAVGTGGPTSAAAVDARAEFVAAFEATAADELFVAVRIEAAQALSGVRATYGTSGTQSPSARMAGPSRLDDGAAGSYVFAFPKAALGGTLTLTFRGADGTSGTVALTTP